MKGLLFLLIASFVSFNGASSVMDFLVDEWLSHAREMLNATFSAEQSIKGMQFYTKCGAFVTFMNCSATADLGIIKDLTTLKRMSPVRISSTNEVSALVQVTLSYDVLGVHFPNMIIEGEGIRIVYKGIDSQTTTSVPITLQMTLDYSNGVEQCQNYFQLYHQPLSSFQVTTTIQQPPTTLPHNNVLTQNIMNTLMNTILNHITALMNYEKICTKLAHLL